MSRRGPLTPESGVPAEAVVAEARALKGVPFRHQGRSVKGLDCLGVLALTFRACGMHVDDRTDYPREPDIRRLRAGLDERLISLPKRARLRPGLVLLFGGEGWVHTGIVTPTGFVHARGPEGIGPGVVEHRIDAQSWQPRLKALWRHPDMAWDG